MAFRKWTDNYHIYFFLDPSPSSRAAGQLGDGDKHPNYRSLENELSWDKLYQFSNIYRILTIWKCENLASLCRKWHKAFLPFLSYLFLESASAWLLETCLSFRVLTRLVLTASFCLSMFLWRGEILEPPNLPFCSCHALFCY